jgi:hypothetical protein
VSSALLLQGFPRNAVSGVAFPQGQLGLGDLEERSTPHAIMHKFTRSKITRAAAGAQVRFCRDRF